MVAPLWARVFLWLLLLEDDWRSPIGYDRTLRGQRKGAPIPQDLHEPVCV